MRHKYKIGTLCKYDCMFCKDGNDILGLEIVSYFKEGEMVVYKVKKLFDPLINTSKFAEYPANLVILQ